MSNSENDEINSDSENSPSLLGDQEESQYTKEEVSFDELLQTHHKQVVWGFKFGEEIKRKAKENMLMAAKNKHEQDRLRSETSSVETLINDKPCSSKSVTEMDHKTPLSGRRQKSRMRNRKKKMVNAMVSQNARSIPLPLLNWAEAKDVWMFMVYKEEASLSLRNPRLFEDFTNFLPRMRAILLDWLMEVCEVYHLRRVTYYLGVDYFDRFTSLRPDVPKNQLQLVGVACLFLAAKLEEIYPPRVTEFSYVCDGACTPDDILNCELLILNSLGWDLSLMTPSHWLNLYMQLHCKAEEVTLQRIHKDFNKDFIFPQYSGYQFTRASLLIDMMSLDPGFLRFSYSTVAAAAMYFMYGKQAAISVSGLTWEQLRPCAEYMAVFYEVLQNSKDARLLSCSVDFEDDQARRSLNAIRKQYNNVITDENHSMQTHTANMDFFEQAAALRTQNMKMKPKEKNSEDSSVSFDRMLRNIVISNSINYPVQPTLLMEEGEQGNQDDDDGDTEPESKEADDCVE